MDIGVRSSLSTAGRRIPDVAPACLWRRAVEPADRCPCESRHVAVTVDRKQGQVVDQALFLRVLSEFTRTLVVRYEIADVLYELAGRTTALLDVAGAGVSLGDQGRLRFVTGVNEATVRVEQTQERAQQGVCVEAFKSGKPVSVPDLAELDERWEEFRNEAQAVGLGAVLAIPMRLDDEVLGAMNIYSAEPRLWTDDEIATAQVLADMATSYLVNASELEKSRRTSEQLQEALQSRVVIEQAKGILSAERRISMDEAFETLRRHARNHNANLRAVADAVVNLGLRP